MFSLTSLSLELMLALGTVGAITGTLLTWNRWPRIHRFAALPLRLGSLLLVMVMGIVVTAVHVNRQYDFYSSWDELFAASPTARLVNVGLLHNQKMSPTAVTHAQEAARAGHGTILDWSFPGVRSGILRTAQVYLPAAYFAPYAQNLRFPVVELFHGYPGHARDWQADLDVGRLLDTEISAYRIPPVIAVMPQIYAGPDSECVNAVRGTQNETYLADDVPFDTVHAFRALNSAGSWATIGYSTGGYCATNLALHHPSLYRAAASLAGYFTAVTDSHTGDLYRGSSAIRDANSPVWWAEHRPILPSLFLFATKSDGAAEVARFRRALPSSADVGVTIFPSGGHNYLVWRSVLPAALDWIGERLPAPTSDPQVDVGAPVAGRR